MPYKDKEKERQNQKKEGKDIEKNIENVEKLAAESCMLLI